MHVSMLSIGMGGALLIVLHCQTTFFHFPYGGRNKGLVKLPVLNGTYLLCKRILGAISDGVLDDIVV